MPKTTTLDEIVELKNQGLSYREIGELLGLSKDATQKRGQKALAQGLQPQFVMPDVPKLPEELYITGDAIIASDVHSLATSASLVEKVMELMKRFDIKRILVPGDLFNMDIFSSYPQLWGADPLKAEIHGARAIFTYWLQYADEIIYLRGNHDQRLIFKLCGQFDMEMLGDLILPGENRPKLVTSLHDHARLESNNQVWLICHQQQYSKQPLRIANDLALKYQCNVVATHQHHFAVGVSSDDRYVLVDNPCMCDQAKVAYKHLNTNTMPNWKLGFGIIKDGSYLPYIEGKPTGVK